MPFAPKKQCANAGRGCGELVDAGVRYCPDCARGARSRYDNERRPRWHLLYRDPRWKQIREEHIEANPFCVDCGALGEQVDHIKPHRGNLALFFNRRNLATRCKVCHSRKTADEVNARRGGRVGNFRSVVSGNARPGAARTNRKNEGQTSEHDGGSEYDE